VAADIICLFYSKRIGAKHRKYINVSEKLVGFFFIIWENIGHESLESDGEEKIEIGLNAFYAFLIPDRWMFW